MPTFETSPVKEELGLGNVENILNNYTAVVPPTVNDDDVAGYVVGSAWVDITTGATWVLADATTGAAVWKAVSFRDPKIVTVSPYGNSDFTSVAAAVASITDASITKPYQVLVAGGVYTEAPFSMKPYVAVVGSGIYTTVLKTSNNSAHFITGAAASELRDLAIEGPTGVGYAAVDYVDSSFVPMILHTVAIRKGYYGVWSHSPGASSSIIHCFFVGNHYVGSPMQDFFRCTDYGKIIAVNSGYMSGPPGALVNSTFYAYGANAGMTLDVCFSRASGSQHGVFVDAGASVKCTACTFSQGTNALTAGPSGASDIHATGCVISHGQYTKHILVQSAAASVVFSGGTASKAKIDNAVNGTVVATFGDDSDPDPLNAGVVTLGELWLGADPSKTVPLASYTRGTASSGVSSGGEVTKGAGALDIDVAAGTGFISTGLKTTKVIWDAITLTVAADLSDHHVVVDAAGVVQVTPTGSVNHNTQLELAAFCSNATTVRNIASHQVQLGGHINAIHEFIEDVFGALWVSGAATTENVTTPLRLDVDPGTYYLFDNKRTITGAAPITFTYWYRNGTGGWSNVMSSTVLDTGYYDDGSGTLAAIPAGEFKKDVLYVTTDDGQDYFHVFYGQEPFATQQDAESGALPAPPVCIEYGSLALAAIVLEQGAASTAVILDARPRLGIEAPGGAPPTAHSALSGLGADDHLQYQLRSEKGAASGYAGLDGSSQVPLANLPNTSASWNANQIQTVDVNNAAIGDGKVLVYSSGTGDLEYENLPAADVAYSNATSGLTATNAQAAIDEVEGRVDTLEGAPPAHAASHQSGGSDEVATATAAADAIPKALGTGVLADGWISTTAVTQHVGSLVHQSLSGAGTNTHAQIDSHLGSTSNPHSTTFTQAVAADAGTDITALEAETLTNGSNADLLHVHSSASLTLTRTAATGLVVPITTTSLTDVPMADMTSTPGAGTYLCLFSGAGSMNKNSEVVYAIFYKDGVAVPSSERRIGGQASNIGIFKLLEIITVTAGQAIDVRWRISSNAGGGQGTVYNRAMVLVRVG